LALSNTIKKSIINSANVISNSADLAPEIELSINHIVTAIKTKRKVILLGNGGSAADAQHIAAELLGKYNLKRQSYPAIALTSNSSTITALSNDYSYDVVFSRQCESLVDNGDVVIGISTTGNSINVHKALQVSKKRGAITIGMLGNNGGKISKIVDIPIIVNSKNTPHIQEVHRVVYHIICEHVEQILTKSDKK
jgi:D-sedoheptulose 7-phosphate isomerase